MTRTRSAGSPPASGPPGPPGSSGSQGRTGPLGPPAAAERSKSTGPVAGASGRLDASTKAAVLVQALPYIRHFWGKVVVVKYGGSAMRSVTELYKEGEGAADVGSPGAGSHVHARDRVSPGAGRQRVDAGLASFAEDIVLMRSVGMLPVVVHGGGPQISDLLGRLGKEVRFHEGQRVTDADTLEVVRMVLVGKVNRDIVSAVNVHGPLAVGLSGEDAGLINASAASDDLGFVGTVEHVNAEILEHLLAQVLIPVVATIGMDAAGQAYNINADTVAGALAVALGAEKLVYLTDVEGIRADPEDPGTLLSSVSAQELDAMISRGAVRTGMIPKASACASAVRKGVGHAHVLDGSVPHALLLEVFTPEGVGTMVSA